MKKKSDRKSKETLEKPKQPTSPPPATPPADEEEKPFDFGGLPDRDLKKNLGCG